MSHHTRKRNTTTQASLSAFFTCMLFCLIGSMGLTAFCGMFPSSAEAETSAGGSILDNESEIEQLTNAYEQTLEAVGEADARIASLQEEIDALEKEIPLQQDRSNRALKLRYKNQQEPLAVLEALFEATSLDEFLRRTEYIERVSKANLDEINRLLELKAQLDTDQGEQQRLREEADAAADEARAALEAEQNKRAERQASGIATAVEQAKTQGGKDSVGVAYDGGKQPEEYKEAATQDTGALDDGADWHADRDDFIAEWSERIDAYLAGSALEGQGVHFARAAWKYNMDPRWSPAISNTESSKGAVCIRPHNAWGWGAADSDPYGLASEWDSWESAIDAHVQGLSKGYGYTISLSNAKRYCPNTWQSWYNKTLAQMSQI